MNCWAVKKQYIHKMSVDENENVMIDKWKYKERYDWNKIICLERCLLLI